MGCLEQIVSQTINQGSQKKKRNTIMVFKKLCLNKGFNKNPRYIFLPNDPDSNALLPYRVTMLTFHAFIVEE